jgi:DNA polymerase type B, organellar and viral
MYTEPLTFPGQIRVRTGRKIRGERAFTEREKGQRKYARTKESRLRCLAVLDMETDPFDDKEHTEIRPFACEIYSDQFGSIVIWEECFETFVEKVYSAIESLPDKYTIYAHNGGKFDFMFLVRKLRGIVRFKGRAIMSAKIGNHELRDSLHILPEKLSAWKKDKFDYSKMARGNRRKFRDEILTYLHSDCVYLFDFIKRFTKEFGLKISIGQAAFSELKKHYKVAGIKETMDEALRPYYFGGRVECIAGRGIFESKAWQKPYRLYDTNSMYPYVMARFPHPVSGNYVWHRGDPGPNTFFIDVSCRSHGAFLLRGAAEEFDIQDCTGRFFTTIYEYNMARKYNLIENVQINWCIDNSDKSDFSKFIVPMYDRRQQTKAIMKRLKDHGNETSGEFEEIKKEDIFLKYLMNNSYGKFSQNPRRYKEFFYSDHAVKPPDNWFDFLRGASNDIVHEYSMPVERTELFDVWARPSPGRRYNNVGTAASITGAARAVLMEAKENALDPIYCDTDSLICRELSGVEIDATKLGAWDLEETFDEVIICGKKTYCCKIAGVSDGLEKRLKVRSKGADLRVKPLSADPTAGEWEKANAATWARYLDIFDGQIIATINAAPTMSKTGHQHYMTRRIRATAPLRQRRYHGSRRLQNTG